MKLEGRLPGAWEWMGLCTYILSLLYALLSLVVAFPSVGETSMTSEEWLLFNPLVLSYSGLAAVLGLCCHHTPSLRLYSPVVPACLGGLLACSLKLVAALTVQTLDGLNVSPGSFIAGIVLATGAITGRFWLRDKVGQGDRVSPTQLLSLCFYFAFLLLLLLPLEASMDYIYSNSANFNCIVLSQTLLMLVFPNQTTIFQVLGRRNLLRTQVEVKKPAFKRFGETELERETL